MDCREVERWADLSADGEVGPNEQAEIDRHLAQCPRCRAAVGRQRQVHSCVKAKLQASSERLEVPTNLRDQISVRLRQEEHVRSPRWPLAVPAVAVVAILLGVSWKQTGRSQLSFEDPVARHSNNLPPEVRARGNEGELSRFFQKNLRYTVPIPNFKDPELRLVGGRLAHIGDHDAAYLMYEHRGARISLFAFPAANAEMPTSYEERWAEQKAVRVGQHRGYRVVAWQDADLVYSLVSDLDHDALVPLVASVGQQ